MYLSDTIVSALYEKRLSLGDRSDLKDSDFGIPGKRKYPMPDAEHVMYAVRFFNFCEKEDEKELADNILKFAKKFNVKLSPGKNNRLSRYI